MKMIMKKIRAKIIFNGKNTIKTWLKKTIISKTERASENSLNFVIFICFR